MLNNSGIAVISLLFSLTAVCSNTNWCWQPQEVENLLGHPLIGFKRDIFRGRVLIIREISMIISYWNDGDTIRIMRVLHQKQYFPPE
jgi:hypothetical protein